MPLWALGCDPSLWGTLVKCPTLTVAQKEPGKETSECGCGSQSGDFVDLGQKLRVTHQH